MGNVGQILCFLEKYLVNQGQGVNNMLTRLTRRKGKGGGEGWKLLTKGVGGVWKMVVFADKGGRGDWTPHIFGWYNLWIAPYELRYMSHLKPN